MDSAINRVIKWFEKNVFLFDKEHHETLKKSDFEYIDEKIYFTYPFSQIFKGWADTNPDNLYDCEAFLNWASHQWYARIKNKEYYECVTMACFYPAWVMYNKDKEREDKLALFKNYKYMDENELFFFYFNNNIFIYDRDNHEHLKNDDPEYVEGKIYFAPEDQEIFNAWKATNPENLYDRTAFLNYCKQEWLAKQDVFGRKEAEIFGPFYLYRIKWKRTVQGV